MGQERRKVGSYRLAAVILAVSVVLVGSAGMASSQQAEEKAAKEVEKQARAKIELPEGFPEDIPIYPKSEVSSYYVVFSEDYEGGGLGTGFRSTAEYGEVLNWLKRELKKKGWEIIQELDMVKLAQSIQITLSKDERVLQITIAAKEEESTVAWTIVGDLGQFLPKKELEKHKQPRKYLPKDIPLYPDTEMLGVAVGTEEVSVQFKSKEEPVKMGRHLIEEFEKADWKIKDKMGAQELYAVFGAEKDKKVVHVSIRVKEDSYTGKKFSRMTYTLKR